MHPALASTGHRPWPLPAGTWQWKQDWLDLAFLHYRVDARQIASRLPSGLRLQEYGGSAWVGLVPFRMAGIGRRELSSISLLPSFPELNLRTYVECQGKPGVWFFSLDAASRPIVLGGRRFYGLPYHLASASLRRQQAFHHFESARRDGPAEFKARYRATGSTFLAQAGTFEHWAAERYCLYAQHPARGLSRVEVHHAPWPLQAADLQIEANSILAAADIHPVDPAPVCHVSSGVRVVSYAPEFIG